MNLTIDKTYNGWANYETWNVALWIGNDEGLYQIARFCDDYTEFQDAIRDFAGSPTATPDGISWTDGDLDTDELDEMIREL